MREFSRLRRSLPVRSSRCDRDRKLSRDGQRMTVVSLQTNDKAQRTCAICTNSQPADSKILYFTPGEPDGRARCHPIHNETQRNRRDFRVLHRAARLLVSDTGSAFRTLEASLKFENKGEVAMSRIMAAVVISGLFATIVIWSSAQVKPEGAAWAEEGRPIISPFDLMIMHGKNAPVEEWRDAI
jgi:hypothetical protein